MMQMNDEENAVLAIFIYSLTLEDLFGYKKVAKLTYLRLIWKV